MVKSPAVRLRRDEWQNLPNSKCHVLLLFWSKRIPFLAMSTMSIYRYSINCDAMHILICTSDPMQIYSMYQSFKTLVGGTIHRTPAQSYWISFGVLEQQLIQNKFHSHNQYMHMWFIECKCFTWVFLSLSYEFAPKIQNVKHSI